MKKKTIPVTFYPVGRTVYLEEGESLLQAAFRADLMVDGTCAGRGSCGRCKIEVIEGQTPCSSKEEERLSPAEKEQGIRLACQVRPAGPMTVRVLETHPDDRKKSLNHLPDDFKADPLIKRTFLKVAKASLKDQGSDLDRVRSASGKKVEASLPALAAVHRALLKKRGQITLYTREEEIIDARAGDLTDQTMYGLAYDIGTTTVVAMLCDLERGMILESQAMTNPQTVYGADVISRISHCMEGEDHLYELRDKVIACINQLALVLCQHHGIERNEIMEYTFVGNTTMSHLLLGLDPSSLARVPFSPVFSGSICVRAVDMGIMAGESVKAYVLPNIAGHVGSDITAVLLQTRLYEKQGNYIAIDIGTNGEILASSHGRILACSTAAGPAFEGASITYGMRAADGAIEGVEIRDDINVKTIGNVTARGICGSGLIDLMAELLKAGLVEKNGNLLTSEEAYIRAKPEKLVKRLFGEGADRGIIIASDKDGEPIFLTQKDIREIQLAKGAVLGGMLTLLRKLEVSLEDLDGILIAGAFGNYIKKESAMAMALLPAIDPEKIITLGNSAGVGSAMALLSSTVRRLGEEQVKKICHVELSSDEDFAELYIESMSF